MGGDFDKSEESMAQKLKGIADEKTAFEVEWPHLLAQLENSAAAGRYSAKFPWSSFNFNNRQRVLDLLLENGFSVSGLHSVNCPSQKRVLHFEVSWGN